MIEQVKRVLYSEKTLALLAAVVGTCPTRVHMGSGDFQFEYDDRCLITTWDLEGPTPNIGGDELFYIVPQWYPDGVDSFPGFDGSVVIAEQSPIVAVSVVRALIWSDGIANPMFATGVQAALAYLIDVGFTVVVGGLELACFAQGCHFLARDFDFINDSNRTALKPRYQFLTIDEARREVRYDGLPNKPPQPMRAAGEPNQ